MTHQRIIISEEEMDSKLQEFQEWIKNQPELPQNIGKIKTSITKDFNLINVSICRETFTTSLFENLFLSP